MAKKMNDKFPTAPRRKAGRATHHFRIFPLFQVFNLPPDPKPAPPFGPANHAGFVNLHIQWRCLSCLANHTHSDRAWCDDWARISTSFGSKTGFAPISFSPVSVFPRFRQGSRWKENQRTNHHTPMLALLKSMHGMTIDSTLLFILRCNI